MELVIKQKLIEELSSKIEKYCDLVWYARSDSDLPIVKQERLKMREKYPEIKNGISSWGHGFNTGVLSTARLSLDILCSDEFLEEISEGSNSLEEIEDYINQQIQEFPNADS
jgi:hypothetical protein